MKTVIIIPARLASTRMPHKMLADIGGKPLIQWTYEAVSHAPVDRVLIAVDDVKVLNCVKNFGAQAVMTSPDHPSGTERVIEAIAHLNLDAQDIVVNVQGDEPFMPLDNIMQVIRNMKDNPVIQCATLCERMQHLNEVQNPSMVKVVRDHENFALYFSRAPIPWVRDHFPQQYPDSKPCYRHVGLYAYRVELLRRYAQLKPAPLESFEMLEQLRMLYNGIRIHVDEAQKSSPAGIDTAEDVERFRKSLRLLG
jgi:3-deoxy-manno-octulosonate cytidylyltransferase (CMP-KDO synthetase)